MEDYWVFFAALFCLCRCFLFNFLAGDEEFVPDWVPLSACRGAVSYDAGRKASRKHTSVVVSAGASESVGVSGVVGVVGVVSAL